MIFPGFIGPTYQGASLRADAEQCVNLYPERIESGAGKSAVAYNGTPGLNRQGFSPVSGYATFNGTPMAMKNVWNASTGTLQTYVCCSTMEGGTVTRTVRLYLLLNMGSVASPVIVASPAPPRAAFIASNGVQLLFLLKTDTPASQLWCYTFATGAVVQVTSWDSTQPVTGMDFLDGFFVITTTKSLFCSALNDGTSWNAAQFINISDEPDGIVGLLADHRLLWVFGKTRTEAYYNAGALDFPFQRVPQGVMEVGCMASATITQTDNTIFWVGISKQGGPTVYMNNGYQPVRVSNYYIERILAPLYTYYDQVGGSGGVSGYGGSVAQYMGMRGYAYRENGHLFYVLNLGAPNSAALISGFGYTSGTVPAAPTTTLVYDATEGLWHERKSYDGSTRHWGNLYAFDSGSSQGHTVTDFQTGWPYTLSSSFYQDNGNNVTRTRIAPHLSDQNKLLFYSEFALDAEMGTQASGNQTLTLSWSDDAGQTWSAGLPVTISAGNYKARAVWRRLGKSRDRIFKVTTSDNMRVCWIGAYLELTEGRR